VPPEGQKKGEEESSAEAAAAAEPDSYRATLVDTRLSHACFPADVIKPGRKQLKAGVQTSYVYKQVHRVKRVFVIASQWVGIACVHCVLCVQTISCRAQHVHLTDSPPLSPCLLLP